MRPDTEYGMSKPTPTSEDASRAARGSLCRAKVVLPEATGFGGGPAAMSAHCQVPAASSRAQRRAGHQRRSMRTERSWLPFGSSMVV